MQFDDKGPNRRHWIWIFHNWLHKSFMHKMKFSILRVSHLSLTIINLSSLRKYFSLSREAGRRKWNRKKICSSQATLSFKELNKFLALKSLSRKNLFLLLPLQTICAKIFSSWSWNVTLSWLSDSIWKLLPWWDLSQTFSRSQVPDEIYEKIYLIIIYSRFYSW